MPDHQDDQKDQQSGEAEKAPEAGAEPPVETAPETTSAASEDLQRAVQEVAALAEQLAALQAEKEELRNTLVRRQADFENYRKRIERERVEDARRALARLIEGLLPVLDAFERALAAHTDPAYEEYRKGFELIHRRLWDALSRQGLKRIEAAQGKRFDPFVHHAVERVESEEHEEGTVVEVLEQGYMLDGRVLRPTSVRVAVHPGERAAPTTERVH